jgi:hypothetical protein
MVLIFNPINRSDLNAANLPTLETATEHVILHDGCIPTYSFIFINKFWQSSWSCIKRMIKTIITYLICIVNSLDVIIGTICHCMDATVLVVTIFWAPMILDGFVIVIEIFYSNLIFHFISLCITAYLEVQSVVNFHGTIGHHSNRVVSPKLPGDNIKFSKTWYMLNLLTYFQFSWIWLNFSHCHLKFNSFLIFLNSVNLTICW